MKLVKKQSPSSISALRKSSFMFTQVLEYSSSPFASLLS